MYKNIIVIPYRNRAEHLKVLETNKIDWFINTLTDTTLVVVIEQEDGKEFNRGKLLNIGIKEFYDECESYFILHDIDLFLKSNQQKFYNIDNNDDIVRFFSGHKFSLGGLVKFKKEVLLDINGHPNNIWGWGMEDRALYYRSQIKGYNPTKNLVKDLSHLEQLKHKPNIVPYTDNRKEMSSYIDSIMKRNQEKKDYFINYSGLSLLRKIELNLHDKGDEEYFIISTIKKDNYIKLTVSI
jgi:hypothetical protein